MNTKRSKTEKRVLAGLAAVLIAVVCLCINSLVLGPMSKSSRIGIMRGGDQAEAEGEPVNVDIFGGESIISENELPINPGESLTKEFYIKNNDTSDVYYWFSDISGKLADYLKVTLRSNGNVLYEGKASNLAGFNSDKSYTIAPGDREDFVLTFIYPEDADNASMRKEFNFSISCDYAA